MHAVVQPNADAPRPGPRPPVAGRYALGEEVARGRMGAVYRVSDQNLGRDLAVKVMLADPRDRPDLAGRFVAVARLTARLQHPGWCRSTRWGSCPTAGRSSP